jgi:phosphate acetyltransferase
MTNIRFQDVNVGMRLEGFEQHISQEYIDRYAVASLDLNPVHIDPDWAARAEVFGQPLTVLHGMATMSLMASVVTRAWGPAVAITRMRSKFTKPVWVNQLLTLRGVVQDLHYLNPGRNYAMVHVEAIDAKDDLVGLCDFDVRLPG